MDKKQYTCTSCGCQSDTRDCCYSKNKPQDEWEKEFDSKYLNHKDLILAKCEVKDFIYSLAQSEYQRGRSEVAVEIMEKFNNRFGGIPQGKTLFYSLTDANNEIAEFYKDVERYTKPIDTEPRAGFMFSNQ